MGNSSAIAARVRRYAVERHIQSTQKSSFSNKLELRFL